MKKSLLTLVAALSLTGAAFADHEPGHKVLVLKNKEGAAILGYDAVAIQSCFGPAGAAAAEACAKMCDLCAAECEKFKDDEAMKQCAKTCRACAKACREFAKAA